MEGQAISKVMRFHPLCTMDICTKCHVNTSNSCEDISPKAQNVNLIAELEEKSLVYIILASWMFAVLILSKIK